MKHLTKTIIGIGLWVGLSATTVASEASQSCINDLNYLPEFLLTNDSGAQAHLEQHGQAHFDNALNVAISEAKKINTASDCEPILDRYLKSWRHGHLFSMSLLPKEEPTSLEASDSQEDPNEPSIEWLSDDTLLLTLPSFAPSYTQPLIELLELFRTKLIKTPNWIIDVRRNGGGSDETYQSLLPWISDQTITTVGMDWLATPMNIENQKSICARFNPDSSSCKEWSDNIVAIMKKAESGSFVPESDQVIEYKLPSTREPMRPAKVAILIDKRCGSSCEQFLLDARQSFSVKLVGRSTYGSLDYSNLRPQTLPSGQYEVFYANSRSRRLPHLPVDITGVLPDIYLEKPQTDEEKWEEVLRVKNWLEGGSLSK